MKKFKFYSDPAHGWLAVKRELLTELNIADKISSYSYQKGQTVYLEEDSDAVIFMNAFDPVIKLNLDSGICDYHYTNKRSPIRSYRPYLKEIK